MSKPIKREFGNRSIPAWATGAGGEKFTDITYQVGDGMAKIAINRPEVRNAFRPQTIIELQEAFSLARDNSDVGVIIFTGTGDEAFCSGGDISVRGDDGYLGEDPLAQKGIGRLNVLDLQIQIRRTPKPVVAMVAGWAIGGGHVLHVVCDLTIAADNAKFGQTGPMVGSFDGGYGSGLLAARSPEPYPPSNEPTIGPVWPNLAFSAAIVKSQTTWRTCPPPIAHPATIAMTGLGVLRI